MTESFNLLRRVQSLDISPELSGYSRVTIYAGQDEEGKDKIYTAGDDTGTTFAAPAMPAVPYGMGYAPGGCSDNMPVSRYELEREQKLAAKDSEIALLKANTYNDQKDLQMYAYIDAQLKEIRKEQSDQAVRNQRVEDAFAMVRQDVECVRSDLSKDIKIEAERRCCGDNAIVTYSNATFYAKQVADVTTGTGTTAQTLYNPLPKCGSGCCNGN